MKAAASSAGNVFSEIMGHPCWLAHDFQGRNSSADGSYTVQNRHWNMCILLPYDLAFCILGNEKHTSNTLLKDTFEFSGSQSLAVARSCDPAAAAVVRNAWEARFILIRHMCEERR